MLTDIGKEYLKSRRTAFNNGLINNKPSKKERVSAIDADKSTLDIFKNWK